MSGCSCINTAVIKEQENERLREYIKMLEEKLLKHQKTLYSIYSSDSESSEASIAKMQTIINMTDTVSSRSSNSGKSTPSNYARSRR
jgi:hypothetical protein